MVGSSLMQARSLELSSPWQLCWFSLLQEPSGFSFDATGGGNLNRQSFLLLLIAAPLNAGRVDSVKWGWWAPQELNVKGMDRRYQAFKQVAGGLATARRRARQTHCQRLIGEAAIPESWIRDWSLQHYGILCTITEVTLA